MKISSLLPLLLSGVLIQPALAQDDERPAPIRGREHSGGARVVAGVRPPMAQVQAQRRAAQPHGARVRSFDPTGGAAARGPRASGNFNPQGVRPERGNRPRFDGTGPRNGGFNPGIAPTDPPSVVTPMRPPRRVDPADPGQNSSRAGRRGGGGRRDGGNGSNGGSVENVPGWQNRGGAAGGEDWRNHSGGNRHWRGGDGGHRRGDWNRTHRHRSWWRNHYNRFALFGGGYYYLDSGYWYPAYGYDPYFSTYSYDAPLYAYNNQAPGDIIGSVQEELQRLGYYDGRVDGSFGPRTRRALLEFQRDNGLPVSGEIDETTLGALGFE